MVPDVELILLNIVLLSFNSNIWSWFMLTVALVYMQNKFRIAIYHSNDKFVQIIRMSNLAICLEIRAPVGEIIFSGEFVLLLLSGAFGVHRSPRSYRKARAGEDQRWAAAVADLVMVAVGDKEEGQGVGGRG